MGKISILPAQNDSDRHFSDNIVDGSMPTFYMEDYSVLAIIVRPFQKALETLKKNGFKVSLVNSNAELTFKGVSDLRNIFSAFKNSGVEFGMSDIADAVYQG